MLLFYCLVFLLFVRLAMCVRASAHLVQFGLGAGEGEGEAHRKLFVLDVLLLHEVAQTVGHVAEELKALCIASFSW